MVKKLLLKIKSLLDTSKVDPTPIVEEVVEEVKKPVKKAGRPKGSVQKKTSTSTKATSPKSKS